MRQNNARAGNLYLKVAGFSLLVMLLLGLFSYLGKAPNQTRSFTGTRWSGPSGSRPSGKSTDNAELETLIRDRKASVGQIVPGQNELTLQFPASNRAISPDFHKLPAEYFMPQPPETMRKAAGSIKDLQEAFQKADEARKNIIRDSMENKRVGQ